MQDWEVAQLVELWGLLYGLGITGVGSDVMMWNGVGAKGLFTVSSLYWGLVGDCSRVFPWKNVWVPGVPSRWLSLCGQLLWSGI